MLSIRIDWLLDQEWDFKKGMKDLLSNYSRRENIQVYIMGTRWTDPYSKSLNTFTNMDIELGWPDNIRFMPILNWTYK